MILPSFSNWTSWTILLTVGHFGRRCGVDLVDAGEGDVLPSPGDVQDVVDGPGRVEGSVHQDVGVQAEHLQEDEVAARLEEVVLDLLHVAQTQAARRLVDHMEGHLRRDTGQTGERTVKQSAHQDSKYTGIIQ